MPPRDPSKIQLDFPQLTADLIRDMRLVGVLGLLDFNPTVQPVFIIGDRDLSVDAVAPVFGSAQIFNGHASAPVVATVIATTGQLPAGEYDVWAELSNVGVSPGTSHMELQHRNAADAATLAVLADVPSSGVAVGVSSQVPMVGYTIAANERLRAVIVGANNTGAVTAVIGVRIRPIP